MTASESRTVTAHGIFNRIEMPFKKTAEIFHMIDSDTKMLIIPLETEASQLVDELQNKVRNGENFKAVL